MIPRCVSAGFSTLPVICAAIGRREIRHKQQFINGSKVVLHAANTPTPDWSSRLRKLGSVCVALAAMPSGTSKRSRELDLPPISRKVRSETLPRGSPSTGWQKPSVIPVKSMGR